MAKFGEVYELDPGSRREDFRWGDIASDDRFEGGTGTICKTAFRTERATFALGHHTVLEAAESGALREWLLSGRFETVAIPHVPGAVFEDYRALAMAILSILPDATLAFPEGSGDPGLKKAAGMWGPEAKTPHSQMTPVTERLADEVTECLADIQAPEHPTRIEARLARMRRIALTAGYARPGTELVEVAKGYSSEAQVLRRGAIAANAMIPGAAARRGDGLHLGHGYVLRRWQERGASKEGLGSAALGFHLERTSELESACPAPRIDLPGEVQLDPGPGKVLKHEATHALFVASDGQVRVAMGALRVVGHGEKHLYMTCQEDGLSRDTLFCFNEAWQFIGLSIATYPAGTTQDKAVMAVLTPTAIWDDLVARADLGCGSAADALNRLARARPSRPAPVALTPRPAPAFGLR